MLALSVKQPWAWAMFNGACPKDIENRTWSTYFRGRVLIHCGKKIDYDGFAFIESIGSYGLLVPKTLPTGGIIGSVEIVDCVKESKSKWFFGPFGFVLRNPISLPFYSCRGQLGFFEIPEIKDKENLIS
jgi:hypothetical protein